MNVDRDDLGSERLTIGDPVREMGEDGQNGGPNPPKIAPTKWVKDGEGGSRIMKPASSFYS